MATSVPDKIFTKLGEVSTTPADNAFTMPGEFYTSEAFLEFERQQLFRKKWICVGREEEIPASGDYFATELVGEPIIMVNCGAGAIKALSNVCRHRASVLVTGHGNKKRFTCPYHAWTYELDGQLVSAPGVESQHAEFIRDCKLPEFQCETWHGFLFVNIDASAPPLCDSESMQTIEPMVQNMHLGDMRLLYSSEQEWDANWKCLVENFMEGYHLSVLHRQTLHPYTPTHLSKRFEPTDDSFGYYSYYPQDARSRGESHPDLHDEEKQRSMMIAIAPSNVFGISGFKVTYNLIQPISATRLRTRIGMIGIPPTTQKEHSDAQAAVELFKRTFDEDKAQLAKVMQGLKSDFYTSSVLAKPDYEGTIWDFYQYMARNVVR